MNKNFKRITGVVTTGALVLTLGVGAFSLTNTWASAAETDDDLTIEENEGNRGGMKASWNSAVDRPERTEDGSKTDIREMGKRSGRTNKSRGNRQNKGMDIDTLVEAELLDEDQVEAIEALKEEKAAERAAEKELINNMTDEEKETYFEEKKEEVTEKVNLLDQLVAEGIMTEDEAEAIESYLKEEGAEKRAASITEKLDTLIEDGTLTSDDVEAIIEYLSQQEAGDRVKPSKEDESTEHVNVFEKMVEEGLLTEEQAVAIEEVFGRGGRGRK